MYYPLQVCQKANDLYINIKKKFEIDEENMPIVIEAIYDSYMEQGAFISALEVFLKIKKMPYQDTIMVLAQKVYNQKGNRDNKENLLKIFWAGYLLGYSFSDEEKKLTISMLSQMILFLKWTSSKQVFLFDKNIKHQLLNTQLPEIAKPTILENLLFNNFYLEMEDDPIYLIDSDSYLVGALVSVKHNTDNFMILASSFYIKKNRERTESVVGIELPILEPINHVLDGKKSFIVLAQPVTGEKLQAENEAILKLLIYLASKNSDIRENADSQKTYHPGQTIKNQYREVKKWDVGFRIGEAFRNYEKSEQVLFEKQMRTKRRPHIRQGHWSHYWYGSKENKTLELLWVSMCPVNCDFDSKIVKEHKTSLFVKDYHNLSEDIRVSVRDADNVLIEELNHIDGDMEIISYSGIPQPIPNKQFINGKETYCRKRSISWNALKHAGFKCEVDDKHISFIRIHPEVVYMEPHHLVPMAYQNLFDVSLDREQNIISLCSNCHNEIHYGKNRKDIVERMYEQRKYLLLEAGINITLEELLHMYS